MAQIPRVSAAVRSLSESPQRHPGCTSRRKRKVATAGVHDIARVFFPGGVSESFPTVKSGRLGPAFVLHESNLINEQTVRQPMRCRGPDRQLRRHPAPLDLPRITYTSPKQFGYSKSRRPPFHVSRHNDE